ncbi:MAG: CPBP family intramembrane metalloprotease [Acidobacteria bacterium]|nr:CPBP family intramembrane metalloprotease [Acidobacteriota bacterium]
MAVLGTVVLALLAALAVDWLAHRAGLTPPGFLVLEGQESTAWLSMLRRSMAIVLLAVVLWIGVFGALATMGVPTVTDFDGVGIGALFLLHMIFAVAMAIWYLLGFGGFSAFSWRRQFGLVAKSVWREMAVGLAAGAGAWAVVILALLAIGVLILAIGGEDGLPQEPPPMIPWIAGLPIAVRLGVSASAGLFEEAFFRGFLQPRVGIALSTGFFVLAHANYEQPLMLLGVGLLSLILALLVRWRQNIWPAIVAHALFDAIQLLIVVPLALRFMERGDVAPWLPVALTWWALG